MFDRIENKNHLIAAYRGDEIVSFMANLPRRYSIDGKIYNGGYTCLLVTRKELLRQGIAKALIAKALELNKEMRYDLMKVGLENPFAFLTHFTVGEKGVEKMLRKFPALITDDSSQHLFFRITATPEEMYDKWLSQNYEQLTLHRESILPHLTNMGRTESQRRRISDMIIAHENRKY